MLAQKVDRVLALAGFDPDSHDGRALRNILDTWPRDELFQAPEAAILSGALRALDLQIRPRPALSVRRDPFGRFVSAIAWLPREGFDTRLRERVGEMLAQAFGGRLSAFYIALGDSPLARIQYIIGTDPARPREVDEAVLEAAVAQAARSFSERLGEALTVERGEAAAAALLGRWRDAFPPAYRESATGAQGAADLALAEQRAGRRAARRGPVAPGGLGGGAVAPARQSGRAAAAGGRAAAVREPRPARGGGDALSPFARERDDGGAARLRAAARRGAEREGRAVRRDR